MLNFIASFKPPPCIYQSCKINKNNVAKGRTHKGNDKSGGKWIGGRRLFLHKALAVLHISPPPSWRACVLILGARFAKQSFVCIPSFLFPPPSPPLFFSLFFSRTTLLLSSSPPFFVSFSPSLFYPFLSLPLSPTNDLISYSLQPKQVYHSRRYQIVKRADRSSFHFLYSTRIPVL